MGYANHAAARLETREFPVLRILAILFVGVGVPYLILSATAPLLQAWYTRSFQGAFPYRLYALSNLGSMLGLITYPFVVEPALSLRWQARLWYLLYLVFAVGLATCAVQVRAIQLQLAEEPDETVGAPRVPDATPAARVRFLWVALAACASLMFLAVTNQLCEEVAPVPFLWVLPLSIYLLSFIICFGYESWYRRAVFKPALIGAIVLTCFVLWKTSIGIAWQIAIYSFLVGCASMVCHGELVRLKPGESRLTGFYLMVSAGGALGGLFGAVAAPLLFRGYWELELAIWGCAALLLVTEPGERSPLMVAAAAAGLLMLGSLQIVAGKVVNTFIAERNFYGAFAVVGRDIKDPAWHAYVLRHGRIVHGVQFPEPDKYRQPTAYYGVNSGVGLLMLHHPRRSSANPRQRALRVGVVGLGVGTIAAYGEPGDYIRFYEINPAIVKLAADRNGYFTYLRDSRAQVDLVEGDARLSMEREVSSGNAQRFDILVIDAFSGDAIPVHLLTREAFAVYLRQLADHGVLALHITNGYLDLRPVAAAAARHFNLRSAWVHSRQTDRLTLDSDWVLLAQGGEVFKQPQIAPLLSRLDGAGKIRMWTDDYTNLFQILK